MNSLTSIFRALLALWLLLVFAIACSVAYYADDHGGNLLAFLFSKPLTSQLPPPAGPQPEPTPPAPEPPAAEKAAPPQQAEWEPVPPGQKEGQGNLSNPRIAVADNGQVTVLFDYTGDLGEYSVYHPENVTALSIDMHGTWKTAINIDQKLRNGDVCRIQMFLHNRFLRISAVTAGHIQTRLQAAVSTNGRQCRITFSAEGK